MLARSRSALAVAVRLAVVGALGLDLLRRPGGRAGLTGRLALAVSFSYRGPLLVRAARLVRDARLLPSPVALVVPGARRAKQAMADQVWGYWTRDLRAEVIDDKATLLGSGRFGADN